MPKKKRNYKKEYQQQKSRGEHTARMTRQTHRREFDKADTGYATKKSPKRAGKDISHRESLKKNPKSKKGYRLEDPSKNRSRNYRKKKKK
jgi:hypothetical protein